MSRPRTRVVVAAPAPDGDDAAAEVVARALRDAGHEVVYTGGRPSADQVAETAVQEDADLVVVTATGAPATVQRAIVDQLGARDAADIAVLGPGVAPSEVTAWVAAHLGDAQP